MMRHEVERDDRGRRKDRPGEKARRRGAPVDGSAIYSEHPAYEAGTFFAKKLESTIPDIRLEALYTFIQECTVYRDANNQYSLNEALIQWQNNQGFRDTQDSFSIEVSLQKFLQNELHLFFKEGKNCAYYKQANNFVSEMICSLKSQSVRTLLSI